MRHKVAQINGKIQVFNEIYTHTHTDTEKESTFYCERDITAWHFRKDEKKKIGEKYNLFKANTHELFVLNIHRYATKKRIQQKKSFLTL